MKSRLRNYRRMQQRRALFNLDVPFDTPPDVLARIPQMLEQIVRGQKTVRFDRSHVASFTESAVRIETVYFVLDPEYKIYMDVQQAINLAILERFNAEQLKFALPSRTVYHTGPNAKDLAVGLNLRRSFRRRSAIAGGIVTRERGSSPTHHPRQDGRPVLAICRGRGDGRLAPTTRDARRSATSLRFELVTESIARRSHRIN